MEHLYVTGGRQRQKLVRTEEEWNLYDKALILKVNVEDASATVCVEYESPAAACPAEKASFLFKTGTVVGNQFYVCTATEVLVYELPDFEQTGYVSLPCFNDVHHVTPTANGNLLVANTGLDMVVEFNLAGSVTREWNVLGGDPWERFSRDIDYRKVATTKPHRAHPNYVFEIGSDIWVTRGDLGDAVCLTQPQLQINVASVVIHDGHLYNGRLYFSTVNGTIVIANPQTRQIVDVIDLKEIDNPEHALLGWCRGLLIVDERTVWAGFTKVRKTKFREKLNWVKHAFHDGESPTHMALYDIHARKLLRSIDLEKYGLNVLFSIFPANGSPTPEG